MTYKLIFTFDDLNKIHALVDNINLRKSNHDVSIFIDTKDKQITLVGGKDEELERITLPINAQSTLKRGQWSVNGSYFKNICTYFMARKLPLTLELTYSNANPCPLLNTLGMIELRTCTAAPVREVHSAFLDTLKTRQSDSISVTSVQSMIAEIDSHQPYELIALDHSAQQLRIQRNQHIHELAFPESLHIPLSMVLSQAATEKLAYVCEQTDCDSIDVSIQNEIATFSTPTHTVTSSLAGLAEFYQQKPVDYTHEAKLVVNIYGMREELRTYHKHYPEIKQANSSHLLIEHDNVMVANIVPPFGFAKSISMLEITIAETRLYRVNLREVNKVKIQDCTEAKKMKLQILKASDGKRILGFYNDRNPQHPYDTVPVELDMQSLPEALKLKKQEQENGGVSSVELEPQLDIFGFADV